MTFVIRGSNRRSDWIDYKVVMINSIEEWVSFIHLEGKSIWYDQDGNIEDEDIFRDDKCVEMCEISD